MPVTPQQLAKAAQNVKAIMRRAELRSEKDVREIQRILMEVHRDIRAELASYSWDTSATATMMLGRLRELRGRLEAALRAATGALSGVTSDGLADHWEFGVEAGLAGLSGPEVDTLLYELTSSTGAVTAAKEYVPHLVQEISEETLAKLARVVKNGIIFQQPRSQVYNGIRRLLLGEAGRADMRRFGGMAAQVERVYRTEAHRLYNMARWNAGRAAQRRLHVVMIKIWRHGPPNRLSRSWHVEMDGEERSLGKPFSNGLMYPGDPSGPPEETINCTCWMDVIPKQMKDVV